METKEGGGGLRGKRGNIKVRNEGEGGTQVGKRQVLWRWTR